MSRPNPLTDELTDEAKAALAIVFAGLKERLKDMWWLTDVVPQAAPANPWWERQRRRRAFRNSWE